ncbi:MAG: FAD-binding oxidoreductase, partial [Gammaproteobacteria bacterium]|nr:FAD-binding oxidoreductase [Gammaproteobacteria bacterium]
MSTDKLIADSTLLEQLAAVVGSEHVLRDDESRTFYSTDVYRQADVLSEAVIQPADVDQLRDVVKLCSDARCAMVVRGGGASYTDGYLAVRSPTVCIDTGRLNKITVHEEDMYVTAEVGVTWEALYNELASRGLRTPFWGPFSGRVATVGGGMSSYAVNYGSGAYGLSAESLTGFDIVLANGELLSTGSGGGVNSSAFFRFYGPDLTGIFAGDSGALGVKARVSMRLIKNPEGFAACSFGFPDGESALKAQMEVAALGVVAHSFGLDPRQQKTALTRMESTSTLEAARSIMRSARSPIDGLLQLAKMGMAGRNFLKNASYSAHFSCEGVTDEEARAKVAAVRAVAQKYGAEVANSIPLFFRAEPFMDLLPILGPNGERWKPTHSIVPFSKLLQHHADFEALVDEYRERMDKRGVQLTRMLMAFSSNAFIYEPTFLWNDSQT